MPYHFRSGCAEGCFCVLLRNAVFCGMQSTVEYSHKIVFMQSTLWGVLYSVQYGVLPAVCGIKSAGAFFHRAAFSAFDILCAFSA